MAKKLLPRRGAAAQHDLFTGDVGEITVDTTNYSVVVHDGITKGGHNHARDTAPLRGIKFLRRIPNVIQTTLGYHTDSGIGGGQWVYNPNRSWADHDGGTVLAYPSLALYTGTVDTLAFVLQWNAATLGVSGTGCWERLGVNKKYLLATEFGAVATGNNTDVINQLAVICEENNKEVCIDVSGTMSGFDSLSGQLSIHIPSDVTVTAAGVNDVFCKLIDRSVIGIRGKGKIVGFYYVIKLAGTVGQSSKLFINGIDFTGNKILGLHEDVGFELSELTIENTQCYDAWAGWHFGCDVKNAKIYNNHYVNLIIPNLAITNLVACAFRFGNFQSTNSKNHHFTKNHIEKIGSLRSGRDVNGIRSLARNCFIVENTIMDLTSVDALPDNCEGIYVYSGNAMIASNVLINAGRSEGSISAKGGDLLGGKCQISGNIIYHDETLTDFAGGIFCSTSNVRIYSNLLIGVGSVTPYREVFGAIATNKITAFDSIEIYDNSVYCRGSVGIECAHHGGRTVVRDNKIVVTGEMDLSVSRYGILSSYLDKTAGSDYSIEALTVDGNDIKVSKAGNAFWAAAFARIRYYGASATVKISKLRISNNVMDAKQDYRLNDITGQTIENLSIKSNDYQLIDVKLFNTVPRILSGKFERDYYPSATRSLASFTVPAGEIRNYVVNCPGAFIEMQAIAVYDQAFDFGLMVTSKIRDPLIPPAAVTVTFFNPTQSPIIVPAGNLKVSCKYLDD